MYSVMYGDINFIMEMDGGVNNFSEFLNSVLFIVVLGKQLIGLSLKNTIL